MESMTLTPTQEQILDFVHTYRRSLSQSKNPHMDYFFRLEGGPFRSTSLEKSCFRQWPTPLPDLFGQDAGTLKVLLLHLQDKIAMIGTDEVGNGSYFGGLTVVASFVTPDQHDWLKKLGVGIQRPWMIENSAIGSSPWGKHPAPSTLIVSKKYNEVIASGYNAVSVKVALHNQAIYLLLNKGSKQSELWSMPYDG